MAEAFRYQQSQGRRGNEMILTDVEEGFLWYTHVENRWLWEKL